jgi:hypothetical protein
MLAGEGYHRGSSILVSGTAGHGQDEPRRTLRERDVQAG